MFEKADEIFGTDIGFRQTGYVVGVGEPNVERMRKSLAAQRAVGVQTEEIDARRGRADVAVRRPVRRSRAFGWEARGGYGDAYRPRRRSRPRRARPASGSGRAPR